MKLTLEGAKAMMWQYNAEMFQEFFEGDCGE